MDDVSPDRLKKIWFLLFQICKWSHIYLVKNQKKIFLETINFLLRIRYNFFYL